MWILLAGCIMQASRAYVSRCDYYIHILLLPTFGKCVSNFVPFLAEHGHFCCGRHAGRLLVLINQVGKRMNRLTSAQNSIFGNLSTLGPVHFLDAESQSYRLYTCWCRWKVSLSPML
ncbi:hypothetical protein BKA60DRAFT_346760 [Fusarium oxysporum]|nr:hypothetical protein BKA60DRAFT_346760 [Fusarium oxysporum]